MNISISLELLFGKIFFKTITYSMPVRAQVKYSEYVSYTTLFEILYLTMEPSYDTIYK